MKDIQKDRFQKARGKSRILDIACEHCSNHIAYYQKDGPGLLKRMYADRFMDTNPIGAELLCGACKTLLGTRFVY
jgi:hypothetical protein